MAVHAIQKTYVSPMESVCFRIGPTGESSEVKGKECQPSREEQARIEREEREHREAVEPLQESGRRLIAQLSLGGRTKSVLKLAAWRARRNLLCLDYELVEGDDAFSWGAYGPCDPSYPCSEICLEEAVYGQERIAAVGAVDAAAEEIRFTLTNGEQIRYPLVGPRILESDHRAFLGDLGSHDYRRVELIRNQKVVATDSSPTRLRFSECLERFQRQELARQRFEHEFAECMGRRG